MKPLLIALLCLLLIVGGCVDLTSPQEREDRATQTPYFGDVDRSSFEEVFDASAKLDRKYGTDYHEEALGKFIVDKEDVKAMVMDLDRLIKHVDPSIDPVTYDADEIVNISIGERSEKDLALLFLFARRAMLQSEWEFQLGYQYGYTGLVTSEFYCGQEEVIRESLDHFHNSIIAGLNANYYMDIVLTDSPEVTWRLIGVKDDKPEFYSSPLQNMAAQIRKNRDVLEAACRNAVGPTKVIVDGLSI